LDLDALGIHRRIDDPRCNHAIAVQTSDEGLDMPLAEGAYVL